MTKLKIALLLLALSCAPLGVFAAKVNINSADASELATLQGIGDARAATIVADRNANGPYQSLDDLVRVDGIGEKTVDKIRGQAVTK